MKMSRSIPANPNLDLLVWARTSVGLDTEDAARLLGVDRDQLLKWESGSARPSVAQLRKVAKEYRRSLAVFYLPEPPSGFETLRDFRRIAGSEESTWSADLHEEFERALYQRDCLLELYELDDVAPAFSWVIEVNGEDENLARSARELLLGSAQQPGRSADAYAHLNFWLGRLEELGVLVHHTAGGDVAVTEMRAFSLYFDVLPVVVLNGADAVKGRVFSLLHEFSHLLLRTGGLCDTTTEEGSLRPDRRIETQCNRIAASILMPETEVLRNADVLTHQDENTWDYESLRSAGSSFGVSAEAFCRRLATLDLVSDEYYRGWRSEFQKAYEADLGMRKVSGGDWYRNKSRDLGKRYVRDVASAWHRRVIDSATAAMFLDAKVSQIPQLAEAAGLAGIRR